MGQSARRGIRDVHNRASLQQPGAPGTKHNHGFDRTALVTKVSVNIKIDVQRMGLNLCKLGFGAAYWAWM